jgi:putative intracellular protease/amidase
VTDNRRTVGIFIFDDIEVLDFAGPFEVFSRGRFREQIRGAPTPARRFASSRSRAAKTSSPPSAASA